MPDENKCNLQFFEASSMRELYDGMRNWQDANRIRLLSISIQEDGGNFCCIALTNPSEVYIVGVGIGGNKASVDQFGNLMVKVG